MTDKPQTTERSVRYLRQISSEEGRLLSSTPDGKWMIEIQYERDTWEEVNVAGHVHQRDTKTIDRVSKVICWEAAFSVES